MPQNYFGRKVTGTLPDCLAWVIGKAEPGSPLHGIGCKTIARAGSHGITKAYKIIFP
jgi:hypothetical protein